MIRFQERKSLAGILQPGDGTRYEMVASWTEDGVSVIILNESFFDRIDFYKGTCEPETLRGPDTNPWTIKAAIEMKDMLLEGES